MEVKSRNAQDTKELARRIAQVLKPYDVLALYGDLGTGKTTFTRFLVEELGIKFRLLIIWTCTDWAISQNCTNCLCPKYSAKKTQSQLLNGQKSPKKFFPKIVLKYTLNLYQRTKEKLQ